MHSKIIIIVIFFKGSHFLQGCVVVVKCFLRSFCGAVLLCCYVAVLLCLLGVLSIVSLLGKCSFWPLWCSVYLMLKCLDVEVS